MSLLWVICGAGCGVGKTTVARKLCQVLPACVYAKCGRGKSKAYKWGNFFRDLPALTRFVAAHRLSADHIVVESNAWARQGRGDITVFVDGVEGKTDFRRDTPRLRARADVSVHAGASTTDWRRTIGSKVKVRVLRDAVCRIMADQQHYLFGPQPRARTKVWFESVGCHVFGLGLASLLGNVDRFGTLREAAKAAEMSYRHAWNLIHAAEKHLGRTLLIRRAGGPGGGKSTLSPDGGHMLDVFNKLSEEVAEFADDRFSALYGRRHANG